jgi:tyrosine-protein kinase Etk/Wzc
MLFGRKSKAAATSAPVMAPFANGEPDLRGLGRLLWQRKLRIVGLTLAAAGLAFLVVNAITPRFQSESRLLLEARENVFLRAEADKLGERATIDPEAVTSQIQLVLSRDLARSVIKKEMLADNQEFDPTNGTLARVRSVLGMLGIGRDLSTMSREERTLEAYYERLNVYAVEKSRVIAVDFSSANPDLAAQVANTIAETYLSMQQSAKQDQTRAAGNWLAGEIDKMRGKVAEAEARVEQYRSQANLFSGSNNTSLPSQQLTEINSQIAVVRGQKGDLEARARQLRELIISRKPIDSADIANSDTMRRLIEQRIAVRAQLAEQSTTLLDQHPRIKELKAQIAETEQQIQVEGGRLLRQLENDANVAGDRLTSLLFSLDQVKRAASQVSEQDVQLRALEREAKTQRDLLESYLAKYREASARDSINAVPPEARIISRATPALKPSYPKRLAIVLIAAFAAFALSSSFTVTGALLASPAPAYGYAHMPGTAAPAMPAFTPQIVSPPLAPAPAYALGERGSAAAASTIDQIARDLRVEDEAAGLGQGLESARDAAGGRIGRVVAVVGVAHNVGATHAAITLARTLALGANVVLVDMALSTPNLAVISTEPKAPGIADVIRGTASFGEMIARDQFSPVHLVAAGNVGSDGGSFLSSPMLAATIDALARSYQYVVIDAGAIADRTAQRSAAWAARAMVVAADPASAVTRTIRDQLLNAGFDRVFVVAGSAEMVAA